MIHLMSTASGRSAIVTGGASGIGLEIARVLHADGAAVGVLDVDPARVRSATDELGERALALEADVRSGEAVRSAVGQFLDRFGALDTVVASAGIIRLSSLDDVTEAAWDQTLAVNLKGAFLIAQAAAPALRASGRGRLVMIASDAGRRGAPFIHDYVASKFGLVGLTESLAAELAPFQVTVNCVCPVGCPTTGMGEQILAWKVARGDATADAVLTAAARGNPLGRNATEADVAAAVRFFVSDDAAFLTGVALDVDGGLHIGTLPGTS